MAKASIDTDAAAQPVHTRTTADAVESQVSVIGIDGSDSVVGADTANGLDVDVTRVTGTVTVDSELPAAAALGDAVANPTSPMVGAAGMLWNGTNWRRFKEAPATVTPIITATGLPAVAMTVANNTDDYRQVGNPTLVGDGGNGTNAANVAGFVFNGSTYDRMRGDATNGLEVDVTRLPVPPRPATATLANVAASASSVTLQASNTARQGLTIQNDSTSICYIKFGSAASATSFTYKVGAGAIVELPQPNYTGIVTGIWDTATGSARMTEVTA